MFSPRYLQVFKSMAKNLCATSYVRGCVDSGKDANEALEQFTRLYVAEDFAEGEESELLMEFVRLQKLLGLRKE